jgi:hypothetical protein
MGEPQSATALNRSAFTSSAAQSLKRGVQATFDGKDIPYHFCVSESLLPCLFSEAILKMLCSRLGCSEKQGQCGNFSFYLLSLLLPAINIDFRDFWL